MKNKNVVIVTVVVVLVLLGVGAYVALGRKGGEGPKGPGASSSQEASSPKTLKDLLISNISQKCTFSNTSEESKTTMEGVVYASGGKVRGDFTSTSDGKTFVTHIVVEDKTNYMWMDDQTTGYKITVDENASTPEAQDGETSASVDMNKSFDYKCSPWVVDNSLFAVPTNITFTDMSAFTNPSQAPTTSGGEDSSQCSACNSLSGEAKTQCLTTLKCQ